MSNWIDLIKEKPAMERLRFLEDNADDIREGVYYRVFTDDELDELRTANAQADVEIRRNEDELKRITEPIKLALKNMRKAKMHTVTMLKEKREEVDGKLFVMHDPDTEMTYELDQEGNIINQRKLAKKQRTVFQAGRETATGTNS